MSLNNREKAFTLIELLVVIAILAVLAVAVTLILNPAELIRQGRDSIRLSDLATINKALGLYQTDQIAKWMGTSTIVYTSLPDTDSTCSSYGLPSLPSGWTYNCETTTTYTNVDGTGWLPVNFTSMSFSSPLARLPVDPVNNATTSKYYTYVTGGSWELSAVMEAVSNKLGGDNDRVSGDGGDSYSFYELGSDIDLSPINDDGLVGYWQFDEGSGSTAADLSGYGNDGTLVNTPTWTTSAKVGDYALEFDVNEYVITDASDSLDIDNEDFTFAGWFYATNSSNIGWPGIMVGTDYQNGYDLAAGRFLSGVGIPLYIDFMSSVAKNEWYYLTAIHDASTKVGRVYINGNLIGSDGYTGSLPTSNHRVTIHSYSHYSFNGAIDDVRIYNRVLSEAEIEAIYNSSQ